MIKEIKKDLIWCGIHDVDLRVFDIIMETKYGTSYNAYALKCGKEIVLFETVKNKFYQQFMDNLSQVCDIKDIKYIVVNHTEPDHAGSVAKLLELNPEITVIGSVGALNFLAEIVNMPFKSLKASDKMKLEVGDKTLQFFMAPNLHWPDSMYTFVEECGALITCDSFGAHYCAQGILRSSVSDESNYLEAEKYYFDNILAPFAKPFMLKGIQIARETNPQIICPGHGACHDVKIAEMLDRYTTWCNSGFAFDKPTVVIPYVSAYGYTKSLACAIAEGVESQGVGVKLYDMVESDTQEVLQAINAASGVLFGTPTILGEALKPIWDLTTSLYKPICGKKLSGAFGSYGWSGEGVPNILERLRQLGWETEEGMRVRFKPTDIDLLKAKAFGGNFANKVLKK